MRTQPYVLLCGLLIGLFFSLPLLAQTLTPQEIAKKAAAEKAKKLAYAKKYSWLAIEEMRRTGIPASIKLAQAIIESNSGTSTLAIEANNHFGMKCGKDWTGKTMSRVDDDRDAKGYLIESCFQSYNSIRESYMRHSDLLLNPAKMDRYGYLFALDMLDYRAWAEGLQKGGYSTNPLYAQILVQAIDELALWEFDLRGLNEMNGGRN